MTLQWFLDNDCELGRLVIPIHALTNGEPCRGCNCKSTCPAWPKVQHTSKPIGKPVHRGFNCYPKDGSK